jgi:c-di-GMP-binding flagellar brake protein YcgR
MLSSEQEKRRSPRIKMGLPLRYQIRGNGESHNVISDNISAGGLGFTSANFIAPATNIMLEMNLLSRVLTPAARVSWASPIAHSDRYRLGLEFVEFNPKDREYVGDYIDTHLMRF